MNLEIIDSFKNNSTFTDKKNLIENSRNFFLFKRKLLECSSTFFF